MAVETFQHCTPTNLNAASFGLILHFYVDMKKDGEIKIKLLKPINDECYLCSSLRLYAV